MPCRTLCSAFVALFAFSAVAADLPPRTITVVPLTQNRGAVERVHLWTNDQGANTWTQLGHLPVQRPYHELFSFRDEKDEPVVVAFERDPIATAGTVVPRQHRAGTLWELTATGPVDLAPSHGFPERPEVVRVFENSLVYIGDQGGMYQLRKNAAGGWKKSLWATAGGIFSPVPPAVRLQNPIDFAIRKTEQKAPPAYQLVLLTDTMMHTMRIAPPTANTGSSISIGDSAPLNSYACQATSSSRVFARGSHLWLVHMQQRGTYSLPLYVSLDQNDHFLRSGQNVAFQAAAAGFQKGLQYWAHHVDETSGALLVEREDGHSCELPIDGSLGCASPNVFPGSALLPQSAPWLYGTWLPTGWHHFGRPRVFLPFAGKVSAAPAAARAGKSSGPTPAERFVALAEVEMQKALGGALPKPVPASLFARAVGNYGDATFHLLKRVWEADPGKLSDDHHLRFAAGQLEATDMASTLDVDKAMRDWVAVVGVSCAESLLGAQ